MKKFIKKYPEFTFDTDTGETYIADNPELLADIDAFIDAEQAIALESIAAQKNLTKAHDFAWERYSNLGILPPLKAVSGPQIVPYLMGMLPRFVGNILHDPFVDRTETRFDYWDFIPDPDAKGKSLSYGPPPYVVEARNQIKMVETSMNALTTSFDATMKDKYNIEDAADRYSADTGFQREKNQVLDIMERYKEHSVGGPEHGLTLWDRLFTMGDF